MPVYAYECRDCGVRFDRRQSFQDEPITVCPECEGSVHRLIQPAGIIFKGSGFYVTDNRASRSATTSSSSENGKSENGKAEGTKSEGAKSEASGKSKSASKETTSASSTEKSPRSKSGKSNSSHSD